MMRLSRRCRSESDLEAKINSLTSMERRGSTPLQWAPIWKISHVQSANLQLRNLHMVEVTCTSVRNARRSAWIHKEPMRVNLAGCRRMEKVDHKKVLKEFYKPSSRKPSEVDVPEMNFIMIDGKGDQILPKNTKMLWKRYMPPPTLWSSSWRSQRLLTLL